MAVGACLLVLMASIHAQWLARYRYLVAKAQLEESRRVLLETFQPLLGNTGYMGCATGVSPPPVVMAKPPLAIIRRVAAYAAHATGWVPPLPSGLNKVLPDSDVLEVMQALPCGGQLAAATSATEAVLELSCPHQCDFSADDLVLLTACSHSHLLRIDSVQGCGVESARLVFLATGNSSRLLCQHYDGNGSCAAGEQALIYPAHSQVLGWQSSLWFLRNASDGSPSLWRFDTQRPAGGDNPAEWMTGVEKLQLRFAVADQPFSASFAGFAADQVTDWGVVSAIAMHVSLRSSEGAFDGALGGVGEDGHLHFDFSLMTPLRNPAP